MPPLFHSLPLQLDPASISLRQQPPSTDSHYNMIFKYNHTDVPPASRQSEMMPLLGHGVYTPGHSTIPSSPHEQVPMVPTIPATPYTSIDERQFLVKGGIPSASYGSLSPSSPLSDEIALKNVLYGNHGTMPYVAPPLTPIARPNMMLYGANFYASRTRMANSTMPPYDGIEGERRKGSRSTPPRSHMLIHNFPNSTITDTSAGPRQPSGAPYSRSVDTCAPYSRSIDNSNYI
jgi:hypothetical protein